MRNTWYSCPILRKLELYLWIFEKQSNINMHGYPSSGIQVYPCGQTGGQADMTKIFIIL
jgi:hypothetical protein